MTRRPGLGGAALAALAAVALFSLAPPARFLAWDDAANLLDHARWRGLSWEHLRWMWGTRHYGPWQPLSWLSWALDHALWGLDPAAFRRTNVLLHALAAGLCALAARRALASALPRLPESSLALGALGCALFFGLHPLRVESVLWITERRDVLSGFFVMASLLAWLNGRRLSSAVLFAGAVLSKGTAVACVPLLFAFEASVRRRSGREIVRSLIPHALIAVFAAAMNLRGFSTGELSVPELGFLDRLLVAGASSWFYLEKTLLPAGLSPYYALPLELAAARPRLAVGAAAALLVTLAARGRGVRAWAWPSWLAYLAALAPVSGLLQNGRQAAADRYSYLACLPFAFLVGAALARLSQRRPRASVAALASLALALASLTLRQSRIWTDDISLWTRAALLEPDAYLPRSNLAQALLSAGRGPEAAPHFEAAFRLEPRDAEARVNLGTILEARGDSAGAERLYREALVLKPANIEAAVNLAGLRAVAGDRAGAEGILRDVLVRRPAFAPARFNLGLLLLARGRRKEGSAQLQEALRLDPSLASRLRRR